MPKQGPGTKLVLKGLARAFPEIAEQRAREEQEERDQLQFSKRKQTSRHYDDEDRQDPSTHSRSSHQDMRSQTKGHSRHGSSLHSHAVEDFERGENSRPESIRRGSSMHTDSKDPGYHSQSRGYSRIESNERGPSMYGNSRDPESQSQSRGYSRAESIRRAHSTYSNASLPTSTRRSTRDQGRNLSTVEEIPIRRG